MADETMTVEVVTENEQVAPEIITQDAAKEAGLSKNELEMAQKLGITQEPDKLESKKEDKTEDANSEKDAHELINEAANKDLSKEEEKKVLGNLDKIGQAQYFNMKKERAKRQAAEADRNLLETQNKILQKELEAAKNKRIDTGDDEINEILGESDDESAKKEQPKEKAEDPELKQARAAQLHAKMNELDAQARIDYPDYDETMDLTADIMKNAGTLFKDNPKMLAKVNKMGRQWLESAANALSDTTGGYTAADIAYEIGQLHPKYGKNKEAEDTITENPKISDDKMSRILKNSERQNSSASLNGGRSYVAVDNITLEQAAKLSEDQYIKLPMSVRERLLRQSSRRT